MVTPLSLLYIGIVLHDAGLKSMRLNKDSIGGIIGRFAVAPFIMFCVIYATKYLMGITLDPVAVVTFIVQSAGTGYRRIANRSEMKQVLICHLPQDS